MDKNIKNKQEYFASSENMERVHVQVGIEKKNWKNTYIKNINGKDKSKMVEAISLGAICIEHSMTKDELMGAVAYVETARKINGSS